MEEILESLNNVFETYQGLIRRLKNPTKEGSLHLGNIIQAQEAYTALNDLMADLSRGIQDFEENLPSDPEGDPVLPHNGQPG